MEALATAAVAAAVPVCLQHCLSKYYGEAPSLEGAEPQVARQGGSQQAARQGPQQSQQAEHYDCFLTHDWGKDESGRDNHARVARVCSILNKEGLSPWFDEERLRGDINYKMADGIDKSESVVCFITRRYIDKANGKGPNGANDNCKFEFDYALRRKGVEKVIVVVMEKGCRDTKKWDGTVGGKLGGTLYIDMSEDGPSFEQAARRLAGEIRATITGSARMSEQEDAVAVARAGGVIPLLALLNSGTDSEKEGAAAALADLSGAQLSKDDTAEHKGNRVSIAAAGGILPLVALVASGNETQKEWAALALWRLAREKENDAAIAAAGGIPPLVALARDGSEKQKEYAAMALANLARNANNKVAIAAAGGIPPLVALARGGSEKQKEYAALALANLSVNDDNEVAIAAAGGIPPLVALARDGSDEQKEYAAGALGNLSVNDNNAVAIAAAGGIPPLVALARGGSDGQKEWAARALASLSFNADNRVAIAAEGGIPPLVALARGGSEGQKAEAARALAILAYNNADNAVAIAAAGGIPPLVALARGGSEKQKYQAAGALESLCINANNRVAIAAAGGIVGGGMVIFE